MKLDKRDKQFAILIDSVDHCDTKDAILEHVPCERLVQVELELLFITTGFTMVSIFVSARVAKKQQNAVKVFNHANTCQQYHIHLFVLYPNVVGRSLSCSVNMTTIKSLCSISSVSYQYS